jgi:hypothetical protein
VIRSPDVAAQTEAQCSRGAVAGSPGARPPSCQTSIGRTALKNEASRSPEPLAADRRAVDVLSQEAARRDDPFAPARFAAEGEPLQGHATQEARHRNSETTVLPQDGEAADVNRRMYVTIILYLVGSASDTKSNQP